MKVTALAQWYGGNRVNADRVGELLGGCEWAGIPFAGGMCEVPYIQSRTIVANDLHRGIVELARAVREQHKYLQAHLRSLPFHPGTLQAAQERYFSDSPSWFPIPFGAAADYFVVAWMTRSGVAGTHAEKTAGLSLRWEAGGGDSARRYHSAIDSLPDWAMEFRRCTFSCMDVFEFLSKCKDRPKHGIYCDPPFFGKCGQKYTHNCGDNRDDQEKWHFRLAHRLEKFEQARVVVRAYDCDFVRVCYSERKWDWKEFRGRKQTNSDAPEVLLVRG